MTIRNLLAAAVALAPLSFGLSLTPAFAGAPSSAATGRGAYIFGDSANDIGNLLILHSEALTIPANKDYYSNYYTKDGYIRFSNGPMWVEQMYPGLLPSAANVTYGNRIDFAYAGATAVAGPTELSFIDGSVATPGKDGIGPNGDGVVSQVDSFQAFVKNGTIRVRPTDVFFLNGGDNDATFVPLDANFADNIKVAEANVASALAQSAQRLTGLGAKYIFISNIPDSSTDFQFFGNPAAAKAVSDASKAANVSLNSAVRALNVAGKSQYYVVIVNEDYLQNAVFQNPKAFGFKVADPTIPCLNGLPGDYTLCSTDPSVQNSYALWDFGPHLTTAAQALKAKYYQATVDSFTGVRQKEFAGIVEQSSSRISALSDQVQDRARRANKPGLTWFYLRNVGNASTTDTAPFELVNTRGRFDANGIGVEYSRKHFKLGVAVANSRDKERSGRLSGEAKSTFATVFGSYDMGDFYTTAAIRVANDTYKNLDRNIDLPLFRPHGSPGAYAIGGTMEFGYRGYTGNWTIEAAGLLSADVYDIDRYSETGAGGLQLDVKRVRREATDAGFRVGVWRRSDIFGHKVTFGVNGAANTPLDGSTRIITELSGSEALPVENKLRLNHMTRYKINPQISWAIGDGLSVQAEYIYLKQSHFAADGARLSISKTF